MNRYVAGRLLQLVPLLWAVVTIVFVLARLVPGDPSLIMLGVEATDEQRDAFRARLGLALASLALAVAIAIPLGMIAAIYRGGVLDWLSTLLAVGGAAIPSFWLGLMLILLFAVWFGWLPAS